MSRTAEYSAKDARLYDFLRKFMVIEGVLVDKKIFDYSFQCVYPGCGVCCLAGTSVHGDEIRRIGHVIEDIKPYLSPSKRKRLDKLKDVFYRKNGDAWRLRTWKASCIFLMEDQGCAVHRYCNDNHVNWIRFHFDLCVTYPLRILPEDQFIQIEEELFEAKYHVPCFRAYDAADPTTTPMLYYMKAVIVDRLSQRFWDALEERFREKATSNV